jgi:hypothetical protein
MQEGEDNEEQDGQSDAVKGQWLRQDGGQHSHRMNLLYEALRLLHPVMIIAYVPPLSQGDVSRNAWNVAVAVVHDGATGEWSQE